MRELDLENKVQKILQSPQRNRSKEGRVSAPKNRGQNGENIMEDSPKGLETGNDLYSRFKIHPVSVYQNLE